MKFFFYLIWNDQHVFLINISVIIHCQPYFVFRHTPFWSGHWAPFSDYPIPWGLIKLHLLTRPVALDSDLICTINVYAKIGFWIGRTHTQAMIGINNPSVICNYCQFMWKVDKNWTSVKFNVTSVKVKHCSKSSSNPCSKSYLVIICPNLQ